MPDEIDSGAIVANRFVNSPRSRADHCMAASVSKLFEFEAFGQLRPRIPNSRATAKEIATDESNAANFGHWHGDDLFLNI